VAGLYASAVRDTLDHLVISPGQVYVAHGGVPHYLGPGISFIEVQEPSDHLVIPEWTDADDAGATMGLGFDEALGMLDFAASDRETSIGRARQLPVERRRSGRSRELALFGPEVLPFFDASRLEVGDEIDVADGRFAVCVVVAGSGRIEGDFGSLPIALGETFATAASLAHRFVAASDRLDVVRCMGPRV
jgi:mannose-6-phosphate isomerase